MDHTYRAVQWNRQKLIYDAILIACVVLYLVVFHLAATWVSSDFDQRGLTIRAYGSAAFILLHVILSIGPLCRLNRRFLPLLYNRRHMGVTMFLLGLNHARLALTWYHDFGNLEPHVSLFVSNLNYGSFIRFPFEMLGVVGLLILFLMAATSHDFWLTNLTAPIWKALHMMVYGAYALLVGHVVLGPLQSHTDPLLAIAVFSGLIWITTIHLIAALKGTKLDREMSATADPEGFVEVGSVSEIPENRAKIVTIGGERVAVFKYDGKIAAISNVCQHQNGPLGEGKVIGGCITCPWHGYQYLPESGASPPPYTEQVPTFTVKLSGDRIFVNTQPNPPGAQVAPAIFTQEATP